MFCQQTRMNLDIFLYFARKLKMLTEILPMRKLILLFILSPFFFHASAQKATIKGVVREADTRIPFQDASVTELGTNNKVLTDVYGVYSIQVEAGQVSLIFNYTGYKTDTVKYIVTAGQIKSDNVALKSTDNELSTVVVSAGKSGKRIQKESVTIEVFKPRVIENNNITNVRDVINKVPGVTTLDGSVSIRGGSGYAYGSGSRVQMVIDDMPLITPDRGEIKWEFVPLENVAQVEVLKGASSVQYGSSALNGVIQVTTANPTDSPEVRFSTYLEIFDKPKVNSYMWWRGDSLSFMEKPHNVGATFNYRQQYKDLQFQFGANVQESQSHLRNEYDNRARLSTKLRYLPHRFKNQLILGLSGYVMWRKNAFQFYWKDQAHAYEGADGVTIRENYLYAAIDPSISYRDKHNNQYRLLTRWFHQYSNNDPQGRPKTHFFSADFQYRHDFGRIARILAGVTNLYFTVEDNTLGLHKGNQGGGYLQGELFWKGLTLSLGGRLEYFQLNGVTKMSQPVGRLGINYQFKKYNYLRFGVGMAYRYGSIAERFVLYDLGYIHILPNPTVKPESGVTVELGYKRSFTLGKNWRGYADASIFYNEYKDMIEFVFDSVDLQLGQPLQAFFRSKNITQARIMGWEFSLVGEGHLGKYVDMSIQGGYTYFYGLDLSSPYAKSDAGFFLKNTFTNFVKTDSMDRLPMLKYRNRHQFKFDVDILFFKHLRIGSSVNYYSYMDNIDKVFSFAVNDLKTFRQSRLGKGDWVWDMRFGYDINRKVSVNFLVKNIMNNDYAIRIAKPNPPRSYTIQVNCKF